MQRIITLPLEYARCPTPKRHPCSKADHCARSLLPEGEPGRPVKDFTFGVTWFPAACHGYINAASATHELEPRGPRTHPPIGSHLSSQEIAGTALPGTILGDVCTGRPCGGVQGAVGHIEHAQRVGVTHTSAIRRAVDRTPPNEGVLAVCACAQTESTK